MRKLQIYFLTFLIILFPALLGVGFGLSTSEETRNPVMQIYFFPFGVVTYFPITMENIENSDYAIWFINEHPSVQQGEHPFVSKIHKLLQTRREQAKIDDSLIRLKVVIRKETFFVDQKGIVLEENSGKTFTLSKQQMQEIENDIKYFSGVIDIRAIKQVALPR